MGETQAEARWDQRYRDGDLPWDSGEVAPQLEAVVGEHRIVPCKALEVGCGTGTNAIWLARQGFAVTAADVSSVAVEIATKKAAESGAQCTFVAGDFLRDEVSGGPFGFAFDRGCFHSFGSVQDRADFVDAMRAHVEPGGLWLSLIGSTDGPARDEGPPRRSATDITIAVEARFEILLLEAAQFDAGSDRPISSWTCLMRRRE